MHILENSPLYLAIVVYLAIAICIYFMRPGLFFTKSGNLKKIGFEDDETPVSYPLFLVILGGLLYFLALILTNIANNVSL